MSTCITSGSTAATGDVAQSRNCFPRSLLCVALVLVAFTVALAQAPAPSSTAASPALPLPAAFAPAPFALPGSTQALEKQLANLLRKLEPVQSAEVLISGEAAGGPTLRVIVKGRAGKRLTPELITTMSELLSGVAPGIAPDHIIIGDSSGRLLYDRGQAVTLPPAQPLAGHPWSWLALAALAALAVAWSTARGQLQRRRVGAASSRAEDAWLERADQRVLAETLARERPEVAALVLSRMPEGSARRLRRLLQQRGMVPPVAVAPAGPQVVQVVMRSIESALQTRQVSVR